MLPPTATTGLRSEARALWSLGWPIVVGQVGFNLMGTVDTVFAGPLGATSMGGLAIGNIGFFALLVIGAGTMRSLDAYASQAHGAGRLDDCAAGLAQSHWLTVGITPVLAALMLALPDALVAIGYEPELAAVAEQYMTPLVWGLPAALLFSAYRSFLSAVLQGMEAESG